jgi:hypothetical protein
MENQIDCKTGQEGGLLSDDVFEREIAMCKKLNLENAGKCSWGECKSCGVIPLLCKLNQGKLLEEVEEIEGFKRSVFEE